MKLKKIIPAALILSLVATIMLVKIRAADGPADDLKTSAKITEKQAREIALGKVGDGKIKEGELERENGKLIWSFDIATPGTKIITEVQVDAIGGGIVSITKEGPEDQAKEAAEERAEKAKAGKNGHISKKQAAKIASEIAPGGKIKEVELEDEHGRFVWSVQIVTEIKVDAITGEIVKGKSGKKAEMREEEDEKDGGKKGKEKEKDDDDDDKEGGK